MLTSRRSVVAAGASNQSGTGWGAGGVVGVRTIAAQLVNYSGETGTLRFTGGFPLPEIGALSMTEADVTAKKISFWVGGVEQAIHAEAMRGRHPNGKVLSVRYDLDHTVANSSPVVAEVRIGTVRATTDISRRAITKTVLDKHRWLLPTAPDYICSTNCTGMPLTPASNWNAAETAWLKTLMDTAISGLGIAANQGAADYEAPRHLYSLWACTGDAAYFRRAAAQAASRVPLYMPSTSTYTPAIEPLMDTEGLNLGTDTSDGLTNETKSVYEYSMAASYALTGWSYFYAVVNNRGQAYSRPAAPSTTGTFNASADANIRFNWRMARWWIAAQRYDGTYRYANTDNILRQETFASEMPNVLTALEFNKFGTSVGAYRENLRGLNPGENAQTVGVTINGVVIPPGTNGVFPHFQLAVCNDTLLDYYHNTFADSRIAGWVKTNVDVVLANAALLPSNHYYENDGTGTGKYAVPYLSQATASTVNLTDGGPAGSGGKNDPFDLCMHSRALAFLAAVYPSDTVNGKTYAQWRDIVTLPKQMGGLIWDYKFVGEIFAAMSMPKYRIDGDPGGPATIREPTVYTDLPT